MLEFRNNIHQSSILRKIGFRESSFIILALTHTNITSFKLPWLGK